MVWFNRIGDFASRFTALIGMVSLAFVAGGLVIGFWKQIIHFPWPAIVMLVLGLVIAVALLVANHRRVLTWIQGILKPKPQGPQGGISQTFMAAAPGAQVSDVRAWGNTMVASSQAIPLPPIIDATSDPDIKLACKDLSEKLFTLVAAHRAAELSRLMEYRPRVARVYEAGTEEEQGKLWAEENQVMIKSFGQVMATYNLEFMGIALALEARLEARGWLRPESRFKFEHPTNPNGIEDIARTLSRLGALP